MFLRYWESEFKILKPTRTRARQRLYHKRDLELLMEIKHLLYDEKFTIAGAKKRLQEMKKQSAADKKSQEKRQDRQGTRRIRGRRGTSGKSGCCGSIGLSGDPN